MFTVEEAWELSLLALCIWREAQGEITEAKRAVAWAIRNRVKNGVVWDGVDYPSVILKPKQFSCFNPGDPNAVKFPASNDTSWQASLMAAEAAYRGLGDDPTGGATHYFDKSMDAAPPAWAAKMTHLCDIGNFNFYKV